MNPASRRCLLLGLVAVPLIGCQDIVTEPASTESSLTSARRNMPDAWFDWTVPARFGMDRDGDGLIDYPRTEKEINPSSWTVSFDACQIAPGKKYEWHVDNRRVASVSTCQYTHVFPAEGTYDVALHVIRAPGPGVWAEQVVTVQDWLIVSFGDSYASGEGVPEIAQYDDEVFDAIDRAIDDLVEAVQHLEATRMSLQEAFERKELAESILATQRQRLQDFLDACTPDEFRAIARCANFLAGLPFETFVSARDHFNQAITDARERFDSLLEAYQQAVATFESAQSAVANIQEVIAILRAGSRDVQWQPPYDNEIWQGDDCHRSANAAPARAARALEESDPRTSVTFLHLACTGARIDMFRAQLREQVPWANELVGSREIDAVLVSIGGNDAGFADIATACALQRRCYVDPPILNPDEADAVCVLVRLFGLEQLCLDLFAAIPDSSASNILTMGVSELPARYDELATELLPSLDGLLEPEGRPGASIPMFDPVQAVRADRVYITEYVDMTKDDALHYCRFDPTDPLGAIPGITPDEMEWLDVIATRSINGAVADAAATHGWNAVHQIYDAYAPHGYCAEDHWVVRIHETFLLQGDEKGVAHPNIAGHTNNGEAILNALMEDLYPQGLDGAPRGPDQPFLPDPAVAHGSPPR